MYRFIFAIVWLTVLLWFYDFVCAWLSRTAAPQRPRPWKIFFCIFFNYMQIYLQELGKKQNYLQHCFQTCPLVSLSCFPKILNFLFLLSTSICQQTFTSLLNCITANSLLFPSPSPTAFQGEWERERELADLLCGALKVFLPAFSDLDSHQPTLMLHDASPTGSSAQPILLWGFLQVSFCR